ncbi:trypsin delta-like [Drosophila ficusphila]|uniref:trypsin delta-like n=1 Tax=Drosophila ficusphila TaxID=30025 RepID=UPI0007E81172|nr:trypsin delta-like [Drosophila ficusphila]
MISYLFLLQFVALPLLAFGDPRIIGSTTTGNIKDEPWYAMIYLGSSRKCGGAIISNNYILTAARCLERYGMRDIQVRIGTNNCQSGGSRVKICKLKKHDQYSKYRVDTSLVLLKTCTPITTTDLTKPIEGSHKIPADNSQANATGCGSLNRNFGDVWEGGRTFDHAVYPTYSRSSEVKIYNQKQCAADWHKIIPMLRISELTICTKTAGIGACSGDLGTPLVVNKKLVGILSWAGCSILPDIYSNVIKLSDWIDSSMKELDRVG